MSLSETYEYLGSIRAIERRIRRLALWHDELECCLLPSAIRYDSDPVQSSPEDKFGDIAAKVIDLEKEIRKLQLEKQRRIYTIGNAIEQLEDEAEKTVLSAFYIGRLPMSDIAEMVHYSLRMTYNRRRRAVEHLGDKIAHIANKDVI